MYEAKLVLCDRDDILRLWELTRSYITKMIHNVYNTDEDVAEDRELQTWIMEVTNTVVLLLNWTVQVANTGFGNSHFKVPDYISSRTVLVDYVHKIYFTTVRHAAVNFYQFE